MEIVFDRLPENLEELKALPAASLNEPEYGAALFLAAMMMYEKDREQTWQMLEFLYGPAGLSTFTKQFINDRMQDNKFYKVKNSWGTDSGKYDGYFFSSEAFVRYKTISIQINKNALSAQMRNKLHIK